MNHKTASAKAMRSHPVIIDGIRTPFMRSNGAFSSLMAHDLGRHALVGLLEKSGIDANEINMVVMGNVISDPQASNIAREIVLGSQVSNRVPAFTTSMACISSNAAFSTICDMIHLGHIKCAIAGGAETFSDPPIRLSKKLRQTLSRWQKVKTIRDHIKLIRALTLKDLVPEIPSPAEFSTGQTMGQGCERMARRFGVSRDESDRYAFRSHQLAQKAWQQGHYQHDVVSVQVPPDFAPVDKDDGPRSDTTLENLARLPAAFDKPLGISTAGSSSFFSDGASAVLLMSENHCRRLKLQPLATVIDYIYAAGDPLDELLLGPGLTIPMLLHKHNLNMDDIDVWELHEAFAAQIVANVKFMASDKWIKSRLGLNKAMGTLPFDRLNTWGGSLSLGHPFGATGTRLILTAARRLQVEKGRFAIVSGCAAGGLGSAILLENSLKR